jgi:hypothetical protein
MIINRTRDFVRQSCAFVLDPQLNDQMTRWTVAFAYCTMRHLRFERGLDELEGKLPPVRKKPPSALRSAALLSSPLRCALPLPVHHAHFVAPPTPPLLASRRQCKCREQRPRGCPSLSATCGVAHGVACAGRDPADQQGEAHASVLSGAPIEPVPYGAYRPQRTPDDGHHTLDDGCQPHSVWCVAACASCLTVSSGTPLPLPPTSLWPPSVLLLGAGGAAGGGR